MATFGQILSSLALGAGQSLRRNAGDSAFEAYTPNAGDVVGPASAVDNRLAQFNGTTGKLLEDSGKLVSDLAAAVHSHALPYTLTIVCPNSATWNNATAYYFGGMAGHVVQQSADRSPIYVPVAGTVTAVVLFGYAGTTAGSNENWSMQLRLNNTSDTLIATVGVSASNRLWANYAMSLAVAAGDRLEIKTTTPTWGTNPQDVRFGGTIYIA